MNNKINIFIDPTTKNIVGRQTDGSMVPIKIILISSEYNYDNVPLITDENIIPELAEWHVYGNEQQGRFLTVYTKGQNTNNYDKVMYGLNNTLDIQNDIFARSLGRKSYELKDHLGNVRVTFSDVKMPTIQTAPPYNRTAPYSVDLHSKSEYYPYGMQIDELSWNTGNKRYGYGGTHEMDNEVKGGVGNHLSFGDFGYDTRVARRFNLDPIDQVSKSNYVTFANNPIFYSDPTGFKEYESMDAFKKATGNDKLGEGDWLTSDREKPSLQWERANIFNLQNQKPYEYTEIEQRADFYLWFQNYSKDKKGFETKWAGAAYKIANAIDYGDKWIGSINNEIDYFNDDGNELIFLDVFPKLKDLINGPVLKGKEAKMWDAKTLKEEQLLVQSLYSQVSSTSLSVLSFSAKSLSWMVKNDLFPTGSDLNNPQDRWEYGMESMGYSNLNEKFYNSIKAGKSYIDGTKATKLLYLKQFKKTH